jgi:hypothetical protein
MLVSPSSERAMGKAIFEEVRHCVCVCVCVCA